MTSRQRELELAGDGLVAAGLFLAGLLVTGLVAVLGLTWLGR